MTTLTDTTAVQGKTGATRAFAGALLIVTVCVIAGLALVRMPSGRQAWRLVGNHVAASLRADTDKAAGYLRGQVAGVSGDVVGELDYGSRGRSKDIPAGYRVKTVDGRQYLLPCPIQGDLGQTIEVGSPGRGRVLRLPGGGCLEDVNQVVAVR